MIKTKKGEEVTEITRETWQKEIADAVPGIIAKFIEKFNNNEPIVVHEMADAFPMISEPEIAGLKLSIRQNGLRNPIIIDMEGRLVDGRNRLRAIRDLNVKVRDGSIAYNDMGEWPLVSDASDVRTDEGEITRSFVRVLVPTWAFKNKYEDQIRRVILAENMDRRHLSTTQKAAMAAILMDMDSSITMQTATNRFAIGGTILREAKRIFAEDKQIFEGLLKNQVNVAEGIRMLNEKAQKEVPPDGGPDIGDLDGDQPKTEKKAEKKADKKEEKKSEKKADKTQEQADFDKIAPKDEAPAMNLEERRKSLEAAIKQSNIKYQYIETIRDMIRKQKAFIYGESISQIPQGNLEDPVTKSTFEDIEKTILNVFEGYSAKLYENVSAMEKSLKAMKP